MGRGLARWSEGVIWRSWCLFRLPAGGLKGKIMSAFGYIYRRFLTNVPNEKRSNSETDGETGGPSAEGFGPAGNLPGLPEQALQCRGD